MVGDRGGHLQPHRRAEPAPGQLPLQGLQQVLVAVLVDLQLGVAGDPEQVALDAPACRRRAGPRWAAMSSSTGRNRAPRLSFCTVTNRGTLLGTLTRANSSAPPSGSRSATARFSDRLGDVRERVRRVDRQRGQHREDLLPEVGAQPLALRRRRARPSCTSSMPSAASFGQDLVGEAGGVPGDQVGGPLGDHLELVAQREPVAAAHRQAGLQPALQAGDPDHVELVEVAGEDGQELGPLQQRRRRVLGERQHPGVEVEPGQLAVEEPVLRQPGSSLVGVRRPAAAARRSSAVGRGVRRRRAVGRAGGGSRRRRPRRRAAVGRCGGTVGVGCPERAVHAVRHRPRCRREPTAARIDWSVPGSCVTRSS